MDTQTIDRDSATTGGRKWWLPAFAGAAVVAVVAIGVLMSDNDEAPTAQGPVEVAEAFMTAFEEGDLAASIELLAPDAIVVHAPATTAADWPSFIRWNEGAGFSHRLQACDQPIPADLTTVDCTVSIESLWADALGVEIGQEDAYRLRVVDGAVTLVTVRAMNSPEPMADVWNTFHDWVAETHPDALAVMHTEGGLDDPGLETVALTDESIDRWTQMTELFVADMG